MRRRPAAAWQNPAMPFERIAAFIRGESGDSFDELALRTFRFHYERSAPFRALCDERGATPEGVAGWREVPAMPVAALGATTTDEPAPTDLHRAVIDHSFPGAFLEAMGRPPALSLIPAAETGDRRWSLLADHLLASRTAPDSSLAAKGRTVEAARARSFLAARQRDRRPTLVLGTSATLVRLLEALDRRGLRFRLPPGSAAIEAGGRGPDLELLAGLAETLDVRAERVLRVYGAAGLGSHFYGGFRRDGRPRPLRPPPWTRVRVLDPLTLAEAPHGTEGRLAIFDLAAPGAPHVLTGDLATADEEGFLISS